MQRFLWWKNHYFPYYENRYNACKRGTHVSLPCQEKKVKQEMLTPMTFPHNLKIVQKIIKTEQHLARKNPSQIRMVVITLHHISVLSESGQGRLWCWGTFGNTKSSRIRAPNFSKPWWSYISEIGIENSKTLVI